MATSSLSPHATHAQAPTHPYSPSLTYGQVSAPTELSYTYTVPALPAQYASDDHSYAPSAHMPSTTMPPRPSWDLATYMDTSPPLQGSMVPTTQAESMHNVR